MLAQCLAGIRVLDLSQYIPGPFATQWLSDMGAEVVKVEPPVGDPMRTMGEPDADGTTYFYKLANRNKQVVRLDLKTPDGKAALAAMLAKADVLVEAYRPGVLDRLGFGAEELNRLNPRLVHCSVSGYGQTGPHAPVAGHDLTYVALTGGLAASGIESRPVMTFPPLADHAGAMLAVQAVLAALLRRERTGQGARLDISLSEAALSWMGGILSSVHRGHDLRREQDLINGGAAFYRLYRTADSRFVALGAIEEKFWRTFCHAVGHEEWIYRQFEPMPQNDLIAELEALFLSKDRDQWAALLCPVDCCFEPVLEPAEAPDHPQWQARGVVRVGGDADDVVEVLLPIFVDGVGPSARVPLVEVAAQVVLDKWR